MATWTVEVKRFYLDTGKKNKKGNPILRPITHRKMLLKTMPVLDSGDYRIVTKKNKFTISVIPRIKQPCWTNPNGTYEAWYTLAPDVAMDDGSIVRPFVRTDDKAMNEAGILRWLGFQLGNDARFALDTLLTAEPEKKD